MSTILSAALLVMALGAMASSTAGAAVWKFGGTELTGTEVVLGVASNDTLTVPGAPVTCGHTLMFVKVANSGGVGKGEVTKLLEYECSASSPCTVESITPEKLPWALQAVVVGGKDYLVIEGIHIGIRYGGALCALAGTTAVVKGTAGGLYEVSTSTLTFNAASFKATGTALKVGASAVEWDALFVLEALGAHSGETLEIS